MNTAIQYSKTDTVTPELFTDILIRSGLSERRPVNDPGRIEKMCSHANLVIVAKEGEKIIGIARSLSDFGFCTYLSDLAVDMEYQHRGIGKELIEQTRKAAPGATLILLSAPAATSYYPKIGMQQFDQCYILKPA